jgi:hypothetical protein
MFRVLAEAGSMGPQMETSLMRAAEAARVLPELKDQAVTYYEKLLDEYPYSTWRDLALERLRGLGVPREPRPVGSADKAAVSSDPYGMGAVSRAGSASDDT